MRCHFTTYITEVCCSKHIQENFQLHEKNSIFGSWMPFLLFSISGDRCLLPLPFAGFVVKKQSTEIAFTNKDLLKGREQLI